MYEFIRKLSEFILNPFWHLFFIQIAFLWTAVFSKTRRSVIFMGVFSVFYFILISSSPLPFALVDHLQNQYSLPAEQNKKDAIVILGGGTVLFDKQRNEFVYLGVVGRLEEAIRLYKRGLAEYLIIDGATPYAHEPLDDEASSMKRATLEAGIPDEKILVESTSLTTYENAKNLVPLFREKNIQSFYLVTSALHMYRSIAVFEKQGMHPTPYPVDFDSSYTSFTMNLGNVGRLNNVLHEYVGLLVYKFTGRSN